MAIILLHIHSCEDCLYELKTGAPFSDQNMGRQQKGLRCRRPKDFLWLLFCFIRIKRSLDDKFEAKNGSELFFRPSQMCFFWKFTRQHLLPF